MTTLTALACRVLRTPEPAAKAQASIGAQQAWCADAALGLGRERPPDRPARPLRPLLLRPAEMPRRSTSGTRGRIALLHAIAHIELNAIDLAWDLVARFPDSDLPRAFYDDWVSVAGDEARHFGLVAQRLAALGARYGDLPAHDGLWEAAETTAHDVLARLAIVPMVLEARGLDVTPPMIARLEQSGDRDSADVLKIIYREEIGHVATGQKWFTWLCQRQGLDPRRTWQRLVRELYPGRLKPPFNDAARQQAGLPASYYHALAS